MEQDLWNRAEYDKALTSYFESLLIREKYGDKFDVSVTLNNIGLVYFKLEDYDKALTYYERSLKLKKEISNKYGLDILLVNISLCYAYKSEFTKGKDFINQAFFACKNNCSKSFLMQARFSLGLISSGLKNFSDAEKQFLQSYRLAKGLGDERFQLDNIYLFITNLY